MQEAHRTLPLFWAKVDRHGRDFDEPMVKIGYPTRHGGVEYLWMTVEGHTAMTVRGHLVNEPEDVANVHEGQPVVIGVTKVDDWSYSKGGRYYGQFTTRVVLKHVDAATHRDEGGRLWPTALEPGEK